MNTTLRVLEAARERYAAHPDHTPLGESSEGCVLAVIACASLHHDDDIYAIEAELVLAHAAGVEETNLPISLITWNAAASTEEVLAAFDRAIEEQKVIR